MDPLQMQDTLPFILQHLDANSLKSCRFVSRWWNKMAARELFRSNFFKIPSKFRKQVHQNGGSTNGVWDFWNTSEKIMGTVANLLISDEDLEGDLKILEQLSSIIKWSQIVHLKLDWRLDGKIEIEGFYESFLGNLKNLCGPSHRLIFLEIPAQVTGNVEFSPFAHRLATALLEFCNFMTTSSNALRTKPLTVSHLAVVVSSPGDLENLVKFVQKNGNGLVRILNLQFKPLCSLPEDNPGQNFTAELTNSLEKILEANKNELKSLLINDYNAKIMPAHLIIPKMPRLRLLQLKVHRRSKLCFQRDFQFSSHLPVLYEVEVVVGKIFYETNTFWENFFDDRVQPAISVKKLRIQSLDRIDGRIFETFPNIEELQLCDLTVLRMQYNIFQMMCSLCKKLRRLRLCIPMLFHLRFTAAISGFSVKEMQKLLALDQALTNGSQVSCFLEKNVTRSQSLLDFPDLEVLEFIAENDDDYKLFCNRRMEFLQQQVFSLMPNIKVQRGF